MCVCGPYVGVIRSRDVVCDVSIKAALVSLHVITTCLMQVISSIAASTQSKHSYSSSHSRYGACPVVHVMPRRLTHVACVVSCRVVSCRVVSCHVCICPGCRVAVHLSGPRCVSIRQRCMSVCVDAPCSMSVGSLPRPHHSDPRQP